MQFTGGTDEDKKGFSGREATNPGGGSAGEKPFWERLFKPRYEAIGDQAKHSATRPLPPTSKKGFSQERKKKKAVRKGTSYRSQSRGPFGERGRRGASQQPPANHPRNNGDGGEST